MDLVIGPRQVMRCLLAGGVAIAVATAALSQTRLSPVELERVLSFGPWPPATSVDPGNRVSGQAAAIELGRQLFFDARLSRVGYIGCVTCHQPDRAWGDGKARAHGLADVDRNTPMLADLRLKRWYGWTGASDSLWMASLRPILDDRELDSTPAHVRHLYVRDPDLACWYRRAFGRAADDENDDDLAVLVNSGKALAAFQETLVSGLHRSMSIAMRLRAVIPQRRPGIRPPPSAGSGSSSVAAIACDAIADRTSAMVNSMRQVSVVLPHADALRAGGSTASRQ